MVILRQDVADSETTVSVTRRSSRIRWTDAVQTKAIRDDDGDAVLLGENESDNCCQRQKKVKKRNRKWWYGYGMRQVSGDMEITVYSRGQQERYKTTEDHSSRTIVHSLTARKIRR